MLLFNKLKNILSYWPLLILLIIIRFGIYVWDLSALGNSDKLSLIVLLGTAAIYCLQFINMRQSSNNQEKILKQQSDIAQKQHDFNIFTLRMNLRNELVKAFTLALSPEDLSITNDVNMHLVNIGKICDDIKFAFPRSIELDRAIRVFKKSCEEITFFAPERQRLIECTMSKDDRRVCMRYKGCLESCRNGTSISHSIVSPRKFQELHMSEKEKNIIFEIMDKYIVRFDDKEQLSKFTYTTFHNAMNLGNSRLKKVCTILDMYIKL